MKAQIIKFAIAAVMLDAMLTGCGHKQGNKQADEQVQISGHIYVITKGQTVINMPAIDVLIYDATSLDQQIEKCKAEIEAQKPDFQKRDAAGSEWESFIFGVINKNIVPFVVVKTDSEGKFLATLNKGKTYLFVSHGQRQAADTLEKYFWATKSSVESAGSIELNNDVEIRGQYEMTDSDIYSDVYCFEKVLKLYSPLK
jgi:hypothetical protein